MALAACTDGRNSSVARAHHQLALHLRSVTALVANNSGLSDLLETLNTTEYTSSVDTNISQDNTETSDLLKYVCIAVAITFLK